MSIRSALSFALTLRRAILAGAVAAALTLGAREAFAANTAMDCPNDGGHFLGDCFVPDTCDAQCVALHPDGFGSCATGCCKCFW